MLIFNLLNRSSEYYNPLLSKKLFVFGYNANGQLGDGTILSKSSPVQIGGKIWAQVCIGGCMSDTTSHTVGLDTNGSLWAWGANNVGQFGNGTLISTSSPVKIGASKNWKQISVQRFSTFAIKTDGTLWAWGANEYGQLGDGTTIPKSSPVKIGLLTDWKQVVTGGIHTAAIKNDGTLWTWGYNAQGQLGLGNIINRSSPTKVGLLTNWKQLAVGWTFCLALRTDNKIVGWGNNLNGQLGDLTRVSKSSPIQVGSATMNWLSVSAGDQHAHAIRSDGTLWSWGTNTSGELGLGYRNTGLSSPVQVGLLTDWSMVCTGNSGTQAVKNNGTLWSWGANSVGQLGDGTILSKSSPIQVGTDNTWTINCDSGYASTCILKD